MKRHFRPIALVSMIFFLPFLSCSVIKWHNLAEQGDITAQYLLGSMYYFGQWVPQNYKEAANWYRMAAEQGNPMAQGMLGSMYYRGKGVPQDFKEAATWYRMAAEQGDYIAKGMLGEMYYMGNGVPQDYINAYVWFSLAAAQNSMYEDARDEILKLMTPQQIAKGQQLSIELQKKIEPPSGI